jgi:hypothetical protein
MGVILVVERRTQVFDHFNFNVTHYWHPSKPIEIENIFSIARILTAFIDVVCK